MNTNRPDSGAMDPGSLVEVGDANCPAVPDPAGDARPVGRLRNLGPASAAWLRGVGVTTLGDLRRMGVVEAFGRVRAREGRRAATRNLLYALHGALTGERWDAILPAVKARLCAEAGLDAPRRGR